MAIKLSSEDLAALNIGESQVSRGYIGTTEIYPNDIAITSASYDAASIANTGGTTGYTEADLNFNSAGITYAAPKIEVATSLIHVYACAHTTLSADATAGRFSLQLEYSVL